MTKGIVCARRIDLRGDRPDYLTAALPHELTHVVLADCFVDQSVPLWADEGMAILADSAHKQQLHARDLGTALANGTVMRAVELVATGAYPPAGNWAGFYGQSASFVSYLVDRDSPVTFVKFVRSAMSIGYDAALRETYAIENVAALDQLWRNHVRAKQASLIATGR